MGATEEFWTDELIGESTQEAVAVDDNGSATSDSPAEVNETACVTDPDELRERDLRHEAGAMSGARARSMEASSPVGPSSPPALLGSLTAAAPTIVRDPPRRGLETMAQAAASCVTAPTN